jgi:hypothetical protein
LKWNGDSAIWLAFESPSTPVHVPPLSDCPFKAGKMQKRRAKRPFHRGRRMNNLPDKK